MGRKPFGYVDFYDKRKGSAGSTKDTVYFVVSYAGHESEWPCKEVSDNVEKSMWTMLKYAQFVDDSPAITGALEKLDYENPESYLNLLVGQ